MRRIDRIVAQVRYARAVRLARASEEAQCAFQIQSLRRKIELKRQILKDFQSNWKAVDVEVRTLVTEFHERIRSLSPPARNDHAIESVSSDFDMMHIFPRLTPSMLRVDSLPPSSEPRSLQAPSDYLSPLKNRACEDSPWRTETPPSKSFNVNSTVSEVDDSGKRSDVLDTDALKLAGDTEESVTEYSDTPWNGSLVGSSPAGAALGIEEGRDSVTKISSTPWNGTIVGTTPAGAGLGSGGVGGTGA